MPECRPGFAGRGATFYQHPQYTGWLGSTNRIHFAGQTGIQHTGASGLLGCQVSVGKLAAAPQFTLDVSSLSLTATTARTAGKPYAAAVAVAFHGTPHLPPAWSIARRGAGAQTPTAVDPLTPIPLIRGL